jgi:hypothetical protein
MYLLTEITQLLTTNTHLNSPPMCKHYQGQSHSRSQYYYGDKAHTAYCSRLHSGLSEVSGEKEARRRIFHCHTGERETNMSQMANGPFAQDSHQFKQLQQMCVCVFF